MSAFDLGTEFEWVARCNGNLYTCVWIDFEGIHVNDPPKDSGIVPGKNMTEAEFVQKAKAYINKMKSKE